LVATLLITTFAASLASAGDVPPDRNADPIVINGSSLTVLAGVPVDDIVAFRYDDGWYQIPVQIDERTMVDFAVVYGLAPIGLATPAYADTTTFTGPDADPTFDDDDELVFMARNAGDRAGVGIPVPLGALDGIGVEVELVDPLTETVVYVYLFQSDGSLSPDAGEDYVTYTFDLLAGDYPQDYNIEHGPNPEDSEVFSPYYRTHFADRWTRNELNIFAGGATGEDILDRHTNLFGPDECGRSEDTFSAGEGAFFTNKDGPVRCIRSYIGANSGPLTQREHVFYERRQDITTFLRVHVLPGIMDLYDYSSAASGMYYYNDWNAQGLLVDGFPDVFNPDPAMWEMVTGPQGSLTVVHLVETDIAGLGFDWFYHDELDPDPSPCTGDASRFGASGPWVDESIPNTDPLLGEFNTLTTKRVVYYEAPEQAVEDAPLHALQLIYPLAVRTRPYPRYMGDFDGDCRIEVMDYVEFSTCLSGPGECAPAGCAIFDWDEDCEITLADFAGFQYALTGIDASLPGCGRGR